VPRVKPVTRPRASERQCGAEQRFRQQAAAQRRTFRRFHRRTSDASVDEMAADVDEASVAHT